MFSGQYFIEIVISIVECNNEFDIDLILVCWDTLMNFMQWKFSNNKVIHRDVRNKVLWNENSYNLNDDINDM